MRGWVRSPSRRGAAEEHGAGDLVVLEEVRGAGPRSGPLPSREVDVPLEIGGLAVELRERSPQLRVEIVDALGKKTQEPERLPLFLVECGRLVAARAVAERTVTPREVAEVVRARQSSVWIDGYRQLYTAVASASELLVQTTTW